MFCACHPDDANGQVKPGTSGVMDATPKTFGVVFCGRQSPGGHNVIWGLARYVRLSGGKLLGFLGECVGQYLCLSDRPQVAAEGWSRAMLLSFRMTTFLHF